MKSLFLYFWFLYSLMIIFTFELLITDCVPAP
jgi:hypothetical protein